MRNESLGMWKLVFVLLGVAGIAVIVGAVVLAGGDPTASIRVRASGEEGTPMLLVVLLGAGLVTGAVVGYRAIDR